MAIIKNVMCLQAKEPLSGELYGGCSGFAREAMKWPEQITIGGEAFRQRELGVDPQALQTIIQLSGPRTLMEKFNDSHNSYWDLEDYRILLTKWKTELIEVISLDNIVCYCKLFSIAYERL